MLSLKTCVVSLRVSFALHISHLVSFRSHYLFQKLARATEVAISGCDTASELKSD